jgi:hypothetical protein
LVVGAVKEGCVRLEGLVRLVEALTPAQLAEVALVYLRLRGFTQAEWCDGPGDGGKDIRILGVGGKPTRIVVQTSVEKRWQSKLREEVQKVAGNYKPESFIFICSRRLPELDYQRIHDELVKKFAFDIQRVDAQSLASAFFEAGYTQQILAIAGIVDRGVPSVAPRVSFLTEAVFSYLFLSEDVRDFRHGVVDQMVLAALLEQQRTFSDAGALSVNLAEAYPAIDVVLFESSIDRLLQAGDVILEPDGLVLSRTAGDRTASRHALNERSWKSLETRVHGVLEADLGRERANAAASDMIPLLGAAASGTGQRVAGAFGRGPTDIEKQLRDRVLQLDARLQGHGISSKQRRWIVLEKLVAVVSEEPAGKALVAAEMFSILARVGPSGIAKAFGSTASIPVLILDANVAMPVLLNRYFSPANTRFFSVASRLLSTASARDLRLLMPRDYLEEAAAHLILAAKRYPSVVDQDSDLSYSTNAFVAHYSATRTRTKKKFRQYLNALGATPDVVGRPFPDARRILMGVLGDLFGRYGVDLAEFPPPDEFAVRAAEADLAYVAQRSRRPRLPITERHDARTVAQLESISSKEDSYHLLVTWDRLLLSLDRTRMNLWCAVDPASCIDLLVMSSPEDAGSGSLMTWLDIARSMSEEEAQRGAEVIDWLVRTHGESMGDSDYRDRALAWKRSFLNRSRDTRDHILAEAWASSGVLG